MEFVVYILYSFTAKKFYTGYSSNLIQRFFWHNNGNKGFTCRFRPWKVIHVEFFDSKNDALAREKYLKTGNARIWINSHFSEINGFVSDKEESFQL